MAGSHQREQREVLAYAASLGWRADGPNSKGYYHLRCGCSLHQTWLKKTPSGVNYWNDTRRYLARTCVRPPT